MPRPLRICQPNLTYHVFSRCSEKRDMMAGDYYKNIMIQVLCRALERYKFELVSYVVMDNHFHFVIKTLEGEADISRIMQYIKARFAERYNKIMNRTGPFWNERYKDVIVERQENPLRYFLWLLWYIGFNPVRGGLCSDPADFRYSSINVYLNEKHVSRVSVTIHEYFLYLGNCFRERAINFLSYKEEYLRRMEMT